MTQNQIYKPQQDEKEKGSKPNRTTQDDKALMQQASTERRTTSANAQSASSCQNLHQKRQKWGRFITFDAENNEKTVDEKENRISNYETFDICLDRPLSVSLLEGKKAVTIKVGETLDLNPTYSQSDYFKDGKFAYNVSDSTVVSLSDNKVIGLEPGETTVQVLVDPYGGTDEITVKVISFRKKTK